MSTALMLAHTDSPGAKPMVWADPLVISAVTAMLLGAAAKERRGT